MTEIVARRYVCLACDAVALMMPADVARRCLYTLSVIAAALAQWSHGGWSAAAVRSAFGAFPLLGAAATGWRSLVRWSSMAKRLWLRIGRLPCSSPRALAYRVSAKLSAFARSRWAGSSPTASPEPSTPAEVEGWFARVEVGPTIGGLF